jgi:hypothetical protein
VGYPKALVPDKKTVYSSHEIKTIVNNCYEKFFLPAALEFAGEDSNKDSNADSSSSSSTFLTHSNSASDSDSSASTLKNLILCFWDFALIVECNCAMQDGDIGRVTTMWTCFFSYGKWYAYSEELSNTLASNGALFNQNSS